jgi:hypothetical protein
MGETTIQKRRTPRECSTVPQETNNATMKYRLHDVSSNDHHRLALSPAMNDPAWNFDSNLKECFSSGDVQGL